MMRGWLLKEKSKATAFGGDTNKRWFEIERSSSTDELILCYYKSPPNTEATRRDSRRGWIFISEISGVEQDAVCQWITIRHPTRTFRLRAMDRPDHNKWLQELSDLCSTSTTSTCSSQTKEDGDVVSVNSNSNDGDVDNGEEDDKSLESTTSSIQERNSPTHTSSDGETEVNQAETENEISQVQTEMDFLRQINGLSPKPFKETPKRNRQSEPATAPAPAPTATTTRTLIPTTTEDDDACSGISIRSGNGPSVGSTEKRSPTEQEWKATQSMTPRIDHAGNSNNARNLTNKVLTNESPFVINGEPLNKRIGRAIEDKVGNDVDVKDVSEDQRSTENGMWRRHERRTLCDDSSSSSSSSSLLSGKDKSLLTNKSFADLEQLTSPDGLEKFLVETHRASLLPTAESPPQKKTIHVHSPSTKASLEKVSQKEEEKTTTPKKTRGKFSGYIHEEIAIDKNFATEEWDDSSSSEDSFGGVW